MFPRTTYSIVVVTVIFVLAPGCRSQPKSNPSSTSETHQIRIQVRDIRNNSGQIICLLFRNQKGFPGNQNRAERTRIQQLGNTDEPLVFTFSNLAPGTYAVSVLHDENGDQKMNRSAIGIPREGYGASQNPSTSVGPPSFRDASFQLPGSSQISIQMNYLD